MSKTKRQMINSLIKNWIDFQLASKQMGINPVDRRIKGALIPSIPQKEKFAVRLAILKGWVSQL